ncbi:MAG: translation initiation factor [Flavobacteriales bacterium]|nr:translation initiation factor [Flavobacteriales bacterium]MCX7650075.1 translation initiation factor [Flavobacteriales bacterium]MDW8432717.1 translation initiation factor [Flavobacteriales bacterium]
MGSKEKKIKIRAGEEGGLVYSTQKDTMAELLAAALGKNSSSDKQDFPEPEGAARAKLRLEKNGRGGKTVTVIYDITSARHSLLEVCQRLKKSLGCGGAVQNDTILIQGDFREKIRAHLEKEGFQVKGG